MADILEQWLPTFQEIGRDMFVSGLISSHAGNLSILVRDDPDHLIITRTTSMLGRLKPGDLVMTGLDHDDDQTKRASSEIWAHRAIYSAGNGYAVAHAHPTHAVALSLHLDAVTPLNAEGKDALGVVPVLDSQNPSYSPERAADIGAAMKEQGGKIVLVRGHGCFSSGATLEQAFYWISLFEESCKIIMHDMALRSYFKLPRSGQKGK